MKRKERKIDNTFWITNIFKDEDYIYFIDAKFEISYTNIYKIKKFFFLENLKDKSDIGRVFLANPLPYISQNNLASRDTDVELIEQKAGYIQNIIFHCGKKYISYLKNDNIITFINEIEHKEIRLLQSTNKGILSIKNSNLELVDDELNTILNYDIKAINAIDFIDCIIFQKEDNTIWRLDNLKSECIFSDTVFKSIFFLNKNNILISFKDENKTIAFNIREKKAINFADFYMFRSVMIDDNTLISKPLFDSKKKQSLHNNLIIIQ